MDSSGLWEMETITTMDQVIQSKFWGLATQCKLVLVETIVVLCLTMEL
jgi:hypothetical protein